MSKLNADNLALESFGFFRLAACAPASQVGDIQYNTERIADALELLGRDGVQLAVFPELCLTAYTLADLFHQQIWIEECVVALEKVAAICRKAKIAALLGAPFHVDGKLFNCAVAIDCQGKFVAVVPKTFLPNTGEFYEMRWFSPASVVATSEVRIGGVRVPFGTDILLEVGDSLMGVEICEDLWAVKPPSADQAVAGATMIANLSASNELLGKAQYRRDLVVQQSARCLAAYVYASAGPGESSTDVVYSGHCMIAENGILLGETKRFSFESKFVMADVDLDRLQFERRRSSSFSHGRQERPYRRVPFKTSDWKINGSLRRHVEKAPFVPFDASKRAENCREVFEIQCTGLAKRLRHTGAKTITLGLSGGLDSTLAALVACRAFDKLKLARQGIVAVTMPGFGTTERTLGNAESLAALLGLTLRKIGIRQSVEQHFRDIGHNPDLHDVTFENAQARERTQILMDVANQTGGFVLGTGDLSELALGWCTFNGDHMSMYHVNAGVPKSLVKYLVSWCGDAIFTGDEAAVIRDICDTPITPELLPVSNKGELQQKTEDTIGPYELHDFFLYNFVRCGFSPGKILFLAGTAFGDVYKRSELEKWLALFLHRFFQQQFKRNAMPDSPKVGSVALSPRGDWRMPSDVCVGWMLKAQEKTRTSEQKR